MIDLEKTPLGGITEWSLIDGQQRLTTLQLLMSALSAARGDAGPGFGTSAPLSSC
jgi:uncharacterized protein with ParB-like and HNH nuclease domain